MRALVRPKLSPKRRAVLETYARQMRAAPTESELRLWVAIRGRKVLGVHFRRQVPLGRHIADFVAAEPRLVVEVDGGYHCHRGAADARRDEAFQRLGYRTLRIGAELVRLDLAAAVALIRAALAGSPYRRPPTHPDRRPDSQQRRPLPSLRDGIRSDVFLQSLRILFASSSPLERRVLSTRRSFGALDRYVTTGQGEVLHLIGVVSTTCRNGGP
jgi:very-short-patch-repair endonuclease